MNEVCFKSLESDCWSLSLISQNHLSATLTGVAEIESDEDEEVVMVTVAGSKVPLSDVTDEMVARMSLEEKAEYIRLGQEMYQDMYEWGEIKNHFNMRSRSR